MVLWSTLCLLSVSSSAFAQTTIDAGKPFKVIATHSGQNATEYRLTIDPPGTTAPNIIATKLAAERDPVTGDIVFDVAAQTVAGAYTAVACARNVDPTKIANTGEGCSGVLAFNVVIPTMPKPDAPTIRLQGTLSIAGGPVQPFTADVTGLSLVVVQAK